MFDHIDAVRNQLLKSPGVLAVSSGDSKLAGGLDATTGDTYWEGKPEKATFLIHATAIDQHFIPLFNMHFAEGNNFTGAKGDSAHIILNETAVREAGIKDPIGKRFKLWDTDGIIIGVVKDFNYASLRQRIEPMAFYYKPANWKIFIKTNGRDANKAIAAVQSLWQQYTPDYPFNYTFVDEDYDALYKSEQRTGILFKLFSLVAIAISCLGLFGLAAYTAQVKTKEIGIRKVLGATVGSIVQLLAKDFIRLVIIALIIAIPIGWWAMNVWLQDFAFRINISWWIFIAAGVIAILIALLTVSTHAIRAALANPVVSLKEE
jgi:putative ABC transport system permease protein